MAANKKQSKQANRSIPYGWIVAALVIVAVILFYTSDVSNSPYQNTTFVSNASDYLIENLMAIPATKTLTIAASNPVCNPLVSPAAGTHSYVKGATVTIVAASGVVGSSNLQGFAPSPQAGSYRCTFVQWSGSGTNAYKGKSSAYALSMGYDKTEIADYAVAALPPSVKYHVVVESSPGQSGYEDVIANGATYACLQPLEACQFNFTQDTDLSIVAYATSGNVFSNWACNTASAPSTNPCTPDDSYTGTSSRSTPIILSGNIIETAYYNTAPAPKYYVIVQSSPGQSGYEDVLSNGATYGCLQPLEACQFNFTKGTQISLVAHPTAGNAFSSWACATVAGTSGSTCASGSSYTGTSPTSNTIIVSTNLIETAYYKK